MDTLRNDLSNCSFVACPGDTAKNCMINTLMIFPTFWTNMLQRLLAVLPRSQQSGYQIPTKMPNLFDDSLNASGVKSCAKCLTVQSCANKLPGVIHLPLKTKPHITELLLIKTVMTLKKLWQVLRSALHRIPDKVLPSNSSQKNWLNSLPLFSPIRLLKSESLFPVFHLFPCHLQ